MVVIHQFELFNEPVPISTKARPSVLKTSILTSKTLALDYDQNVFSFGFAAHHYADTARNRFAFRLENYDEKWNFVNANKRFASYTNLDSGSYTFVVKAANKDGVWAKQAAVMHITIATPPWKSWWAYSLYVAFLLGSPAFIYRYRTKKIRQTAKKLEQLVGIRTNELAQKNQLVENLLAQKNEEFANVSHEFRTPLTLILGAIKSVLKSEVTDVLKDKMRTAQRNSYRLIRMVDQLLQIERFNVQSILQSRPQAVKPMISLIAQSFQDLAKEKRIQLVIEQIDDVWIEFTVDALEKIILNLLSNALKYTNEQGTITLNARLIDNNWFKLSIEDTGIGISEQKQPVVFERFTRAEEEHREKITGAGIGLALVKKLVEAHEGSIALESCLGQGSTFTVLLPNVLSQAPQGDTATLNIQMLELELENLTYQRSSTPSPSTPTVVSHAI